jgi:hypothetical protein
MNLAPYVKHSAKFQAVQYAVVLLLTLFIAGVGKTPFPTAAEGILLLLYGMFVSLLFFVVFSVPNVIYIAQAKTYSKVIGFPLYAVAEYVKWHLLLLFLVQALGVMGMTLRRDISIPIIALVLAVLLSAKHTERKAKKKKTS